MSTIRPGRIRPDSIRPDSIRAGATRPTRPSATGPGTARPSRTRPTRPGTTHPGTTRPRPTRPTRPSATGPSSTTRTGTTRTSTTRFGTGRIGASGCTAPRLDLRGLCGAALDATRTDGAGLAPAGCPTAGIGAAGSASTGTFPGSAHTDLSVAGRLDGSGPGAGSTEAAGIAARVVSTDRASAAQADGSRGVDVVTGAGLRVARFGGDGAVGGLAAGLVDPAGRAILGTAGRRTTAAPWTAVRAVAARSAAGAVRLGDLEITVPDRPEDRTVRTQPTPACTPAPGAPAPGARPIGTGPAGTGRTVTRPAVPPQAGTGPASRIVKPTGRAQTGTVRPGTPQVDTVQSGASQCSTSQISTIQISTTQPGPTQPSTTEASTTRTLAAVDRSAPDRTDLSRPIAAQPADRSMGGQRSGLADTPGGALRLRRHVDRLRPGRPDRPPRCDVLRVAARRTPSTHQHHARSRHHARAQVVHAVHEVGRDRTALERQYAWSVLHRQQPVGPRRGVGSGERDAGVGDDQSDRAEQEHRPLVSADRDGAEAQVRARGVRSAEPHRQSPGQDPARIGARGAGAHVQ
ncbi:hypothetical protein [Pseudonocardia sp.]|uniref:hypothetical protein n=1 Tax=Pseudonocardia sp. TaxID=60912 RepID=UPI0031FC26A7